MRATILTTAPAVRFEGCGLLRADRRPSTGGPRGAGRQHLRRARAERAGKSTLLKVASGQLRPTAGTLKIEGLSVRRVSPEAFARSGVCAIPEGRGVFP